MGLSRGRGAGGSMFEPTDPGYIGKTIGMEEAALKACRSVQERIDFLTNLDFRDLEDLVNRGAVKRVEAIRIRRAKRGRR